MMSDGTLSDLEAGGHSLLFILFLIERKVLECAGRCLCHCGSGTAVQTTASDDKASRTLLR